MESLQLQQLFFQQIKGKIPPNKSFVDEIADLLEISNDSAYRRIRGEKQISFEEIKKMASHYKISLDQLLHLKTDSFIFTGRITNNSDYKFEEWQKSVLTNLQTVASFKPNHYYYIAKEIPFLYYYMIPEIAAFKAFFFLKSILFYDDWKTAKFSVTDDYSQHHEIWKNISNTYTSIPGTEIWSLDNITSTIHQIEYYRLTGSLKSIEDAHILLDKLEELINHIEKQAEYGVKLKYNQEPIAGLAPFKMFVNELILGDNMQLMELAGNKVTYINFSVLNFILTQDESFNNYTKKNFDIITQKSILISEVNERERLLFFNRLRDKIHTAKLQIQ
jgi:hypothetical protein